MIVILLSLLQIKRRHIYSKQTVSVNKKDVDIPVLKQIDSVNKGFLQQI